MADLQRGAAGDVQRPVGMGAVQVRVRADGFRLHPNAKIQPQRVDLAAQARHAAGQLAAVGRPVAQAGGVGIAALEPAVVQHEQVGMGGPGGFGQGQQFGLVKVEIAGLPAVQQHRAGRGGVGPAGRDQMPPDGVVEIPAHAAKPGAAVRKGRFRGGEPLAGGQRPGKAERLDA